MKRILSLSFFVLSLICIVSVGYSSQYCILLYPAFFMLFIALFIQTYEVLKVKKQATIKAYYKQDSWLSRHFGRFLFVKIISGIFACVGSVSLFFMLLFPSGSDIFIFCVLVPCSIYAFKVAKIICKANINLDFASILAKKYSALFCAVCACAGEFILNSFALQQIHITSFQGHYEMLLESFHIAQMPCQLWQELFGFIVLKKAIVDMLYFSNDSLRIVLNVLFAFGYFSSFVSFSLLVLSGYSTKLESKNNSESHQDSKIQTYNSRAFKQFFAVVFFLIFVCLAFYVSSLLQPLAKSSKFAAEILAPEILATQFLAQNQQYIEVSIQGVQSFVNTKDIADLQHKIESTLKDFETNLNHSTQASLEEYLAKKDIIIDEYSKWYFSVYGEYTRLFYAAIGRGEDIAQEQFVFLLKAYTPNDLQERLNRVYDVEFDKLKKRLEQDFSFFTINKKPSNAFISHSVSFDDFTQNLNVLNPRATDGIAALLGASVVGAMIIKTSSKAMAKTGAKLVGKSVAKKGLSGAAGAGGSLVCGPFAPLCAIGFFVAADVGINSVDEALNQEAFKNQMREGFTQWEIQLKNSLVSYNSQLSKQIYENLRLDSQSHQQKEQ
ncbi:Uncharacterised protein [Helicobacter cinaedi]|uniref:Transmembrane protein n=1 Tax=Helicobacter cinaedi TaxID=213 RepID=A0A377JSH2_9HELI|nr:hypothetical protein [Helicobacter cinaedi]STP10931.1 Uncharacterised protein [Helicobacter cinaedi]